MISDKPALKRINSDKKSFFGTKFVFFGLMRSFLINKNLCFYYWLRKKVGKTWAFRVASRLEKVLLVCGRESWVKEP